MTAPSNTVPKGPRATRGPRNEFRSMMEVQGLDRNLQMIVCDEALTKHPLDKVLKQLGQGRAWHQHIVAILSFWPALRYSTRFFIVTVGVELRARGGRTSLIDHTFRAFEQHVHSLLPQPRDTEADWAAEYLVTPTAYRALIDHMTAALRYAALLECRAAAGDVWTLADGPFDRWRRRHAGPLQILEKPEAHYLSDEQIRAKFMLSVELDFYHQRFRDEGGG